MMRLEAFRAVKCELQQFWSMLTSNINYLKFIQKWQSMQKYKYLGYNRDIYEKT